MRISNLLPNAVLPQLPKELISRVEQFATCEMNKDEVKAFRFAYLAITKYAKLNPFVYGINCLVVFSAGEPIELTPISDSFGITEPIIFIRLDVLRERCSDDIPSQCILTLLEELCHALYAIGSEYRVKYRVREILLEYFSDRSLHSLWPKVFDESNQPNPEIYPDDYKALSL